jgi:hypothetical protein
MVNETLADRRKRTTGKTLPPCGGQGPGAKRASAQAKKDVAASEPCEHCGKKHAGECWYKPGSKKSTRAEKKALKAAAELDDYPFPRWGAGRIRVLRWKKLLTSTRVFPSYLSPPASLAHARSSEQISLLQTPPEMRTPTHRRKYRSPTRATHHSI